ncbi:MFS transporter [Nocardioides zeae]|uniref:Putative proline/betaine transporter n=1 Tax=Nocardioides zeae TaxID=1457234 RepID=A0AAJ1X2T2_9ACTN|nr:MFS transporter [Nocardioides zeae]MDQ1105634.1 metabolite-proton symporter [Nocardioides zeae]
MSATTAAGRPGPSDAPRVPPRREPTPTQRRRVAAASLIGTTIEWYDYFIFGSAAALVFGPLFFPQADPLTGTLAAFATFAVGFIARPIGGIVMGHFGDRVGRKSMLVTSMMLMGVATVLIGLLPTYETIGIAAPILLVVLRLVQGFGVGGEWGGAVLMSVEYAPPRRRAIFGSLPQMGLPAGVILANVAFIVAVQRLAPGEFAAWGWRVPFLLSAVLIVVGLVLRLKVQESPEFAALREDKEVLRSPLVQVFRSHKSDLLLASAASIAAPALGYLILVYMLSYGVGVIGHSSQTVLWLIVVASLAWLVAIGISAVVAERVGRKRVFLAGALLVSVWAFPFFRLVDSGEVVSMGVALSVAAVAVATMAGPQAALVADLFPASVRYSGSSLAYQVGSVLGGAFAPTIATSLFAAYAASWPIAVYMAALGAASFLALLFLREEEPVPAPVGDGV